MEDTSQFLQWAMDMLRQDDDNLAAPAVDLRGAGEATFPSLRALREASQAADMVRELMAEEPEHQAHNRSSSGDSSNTGGKVRPPTSSSTVLPAVSWDFSTGSAQPGSDGGASATAQAATRGLADPVRRASPLAKRALARKSSGPASSASYTPDHIIAERKRRERINKRIIELSTVIPGIKKMDKATILADAARYVKELQERLRAMEEQAAKKPCVVPPEENGSSSSSSVSSESEAPPPAATKPLPEIEARVSEKAAMVRIHCDGGKGVAVRALGEVERLGLGIVHANVMPFSASTLIITITAKVEEGFSMTTEEIVRKLNSALSNQLHNSCNGAC